MMMEVTKHRIRRFFLIQGIIWIAIIALWSLSSFGFEAIGLDNVVVDNEICGATDAGHEVCLPVVRTMADKMKIPALYFMFVLAAVSFVYWIVFWIGSARLYLKEKK